MVTFEQQIHDLAAIAGARCKSLSIKIGALTSLSTTDKSSLVAAINELKTSVLSLADTLNGYGTRLGTAETAISTNKTELATAKTNISTLQSTVQQLTTDLNTLEELVEEKAVINDDAATAVSTWSSSKISSSLTEAKQSVKNEILGGVGEAYDTLKELHTAIEANKDLIESFQTVAAGHVKFDAPQELTDAQKTQARGNIGAASAVDHSNLAGRVSTAESKITTLETNHNNLVTQLGNITNADFVATFESAAAGS